MEPDSLKRHRLPDSLLAHDRSEREQSGGQRPEIMVTRRYISDKDLGAVSDVPLWRRAEDTRSGSCRLVFETLGANEGGPDMAPHTPQRLERPGKPVALLDNRRSPLHVHDQTSFVAARGLVHRDAVKRRRLDDGAEPVTRRVDRLTVQAGW